MFKIIFLHWKIVPALSNKSRNVSYVNTFLHCNARHEKKHGSCARAQGRAKDLNRLLRLKNGSVFQSMFTMFKTTKLIKI